MKSFRDDLNDRMKTGWGRFVLASKKQLYNWNFVRGKKSCLPAFSQPLLTRPPPSFPLRVCMCAQLTVRRVDSLPPYFIINSSYIGLRLCVLASLSFPSFKVPHNTFYWVDHSQPVLIQTINGWLKYGVRCTVQKLKRGNLIWACFICMRHII